MIENEEACVYTLIFGISVLSMSTKTSKDEAGQGKLSPNKQNVRHIFSMRKKNNIFKMASKMASSSKTAKAEELDDLSNPWANIIKFFILGLICLLAFCVRLFAVVRYESVCVCFCFSPNEHARRKKKKNSCTFPLFPLLSHNN